MSCGYSGDRARFPERTGDSPECLQHISPSSALSMGLGRGTRLRIHNLRGFQKCRRPTVHLIRYGHVSQRISLWKNRVSHPERACVQTKLGRTHVMGCLAAIDFSPSHRPERESWPQGWPRWGVTSRKNLRQGCTQATASGCGSPGQQWAEQKAGLAGPGGLPGGPLRCCSLGGWRAAWELHAACGLFYPLSVLPQNFRRHSPGHGLQVPPTAPAPSLCLPQTLCPLTSCTARSAWVSASGRLIRQCGPSLCHTGELTGRMWAHGHEACCCYIHSFLSSSLRATVAFCQAMTYSRTIRASDPWFAGFCSGWVLWTRSEREFNGFW